MQNRRQDHFKERGLYYLSRSIVNQGVRGDWNFQLDAVYGVFFVNFYLNGKEQGKFRKDVAFMDMETGKVFCDKLRQIYIELPGFNKTEEECENDFERWIYVLKNMDIMKRMPFKAKKAVFDRLEQIASKAESHGSRYRNYNACHRLKCRSYRKVITPLPDAYTSKKVSIDIANETENRLLKYRKDRTMR